MHSSVRYCRQVRAYDMYTGVRDGDKNIAKVNLVYTYTYFTSGLFKYF